MVDPWEVEQRQYTRTLHVLQHVQQGLGALFSAGQAPTPAEVRVLLCVVCLHFACAAAPAAAQMGGAGTAGRAAGRRGGGGLRRLGQWAWPMA